MKPHTPPGIAPPFGRYAHGTEIPPGWRILQTSGQLGLGADGAVPTDTRAQADICFAQIAAILHSAQMGPQDIAHLTAYVTTREDMPAYMAARDAFLAGLTRLPSSTLLIVSGFTRPEFKVEIEAIAAAP